MKWVLIIFLMSPDNRYETKVHIPFPSYEACQASLNEMDEHLENGGFWDGLCVTQDHLTGKEYMEDVPLD